MGSLRCAEYQARDRSSLWVSVTKIVALRAAASSRAYSGRAIGRALGGR
jgi:hypothetical protein